MKIIAIATTGGEENYVLDEKPALKFVKDGNTIFGTDGVFCSCYYYQRPNRWAQAFGGRYFEIELKDGSVEKCTGQWWSGVTKRAQELAGGKIGHCGVAWAPYGGTFYSYHCIESELRRLRKEYAGPIYTHREFAEILRRRRLVGK